MKAYKKLLSSTLKCDELAGYSLVKVTDANICIEMASYEIAVSVIDDLIFEIKRAGSEKKLTKVEQNRSTWILDKLREKQRLYKNKLAKIS